jgi:hypothetical protein
MRGIAVVLTTIFVSALLFGVFAPAILEPIGQAVTGFQTVQNSQIDAAGLFDGLKNVLLIWAPILTIGASIVFGVRYYLKRERFVGVRRR